MDRKWNFSLCQMQTVWMAQGRKRGHHCLTLSCSCYGKDSHITVLDLEDALWFNGR